MFTRLNTFWIKWIQLIWQSLNNMSEYWSMSRFSNIHHVEKCKYTVIRFEKKKKIDDKICLRKKKYIYRVFQKKRVRKNVLIAHNTLHVHMITKCCSNKLLLIWSLIFEDMVRNVNVAAASGAVWYRCFHSFTQRNGYVKMAPHMFL